LSEQIVSCVVKKPAHPGFKPRAFFVGTSSPAKSHCWVHLETTDYQLLRNHESKTYWAIHAAAAISAGLAKQTRNTGLIMKNSSQYILIVTTAFFDVLAEAEDVLQNVADGLTRIRNRTRNRSCTIPLSPFETTTNATKP
jgi:hypothetical protein